MRGGMGDLCPFYVAISAQIIVQFFWLNEENFWLALWKNLYLYLSGNTSFKTLRIIFWYSWSFLFLDWSLGILSISFVVFALIFSRCLKGFMMTVNWITISFPYSLNLNETVCPLIGHLYHSGWTFRCWVLGCVVWEIKTVLTWCSFASLTGTSVKEIVVFKLSSLFLSPCIRQLLKLTHWYD